jgi:hypothetical protein
MASTDLDLNAMFGRASVQVDPEETPEEHTARLGQERADAKLRRVKEYVVFFVIVGALSHSAFFVPTRASSTPVQALPPSDGPKRLYRPCLLVP